MLQIIIRDGLQIEIQQACFRIGDFLIQKYETILQIERDGCGISIHRIPCSHLHVFF